MFQAVYGKTLDEYMELYGDAYNNRELWDFSLSDLEDGSIEPDPDKIYWEIDGRFYETEE